MFDTLFKSIEDSNLRILSTLLFFGGEDSSDDIVLRIKRKCKKS